MAMYDIARELDGLLRLPSADVGRVATLVAKLEAANDELAKVALPGWLQDRKAIAGMQELACKQTDWPTDPLRYLPLLR